MKKKLLALLLASAVTSGVWAVPPAEASTEVWYYSSVFWGDVAGRREASNAMRSANAGVALDAISFRARSTSFTLTVVDGTVPPGMTMPAGIYARGRTLFEGCLTTAKARRFKVAKGALVTIRMWDNPLRPLRCSTVATGGIATIEH